MKVFGTLDSAQAEIVTSDPASAAQKGRFIYNKTTGVYKIADGTSWLALGGKFLELNEPSGVNKVTLIPPALAADYTLTLPVDDGGANQVLKTDGSGVLSWTDVLSTPAQACDSVLNIGCSYSAGTFTIHGADGTALSAGNPGFIRIGSTTSGRSKVFTITANVSFNDDAHASSDITGEEFGTTAGTAWSLKRPFFLYAANLDDTNAGIAFFISPDPRKVEVPIATYIGYKGNPAATPSDYNAFFLTSSSPSAYAGKPCVRLGGLTMVKSSADDWTVQNFSYAFGDGIRPDLFRGQIFGLPELQMGATSQHCLANGGTAPVFSTSIVNYELNDNGECIVYYDIEGDGGTDGAGAVSMKIATPYKVLTVSIGLSDAWSGWTPIRIGVPGGGTIRFAEAATTDQSYLTVLDTSTNNILWSAFTNGSRHIWGRVPFRAF